MDERLKREVFTMIDEIDVLKLKVRELEAERAAMIRQMESLTPGGSEFAGDFEACLRFVSDRLRSVVAVARERNELRGKLSTVSSGVGELVEAAEKVYSFRDVMFSDGPHALSLSLAMIDLHKAVEKIRQGESSESPSPES